MAKNSTFEKNEKRKTRQSLCSSGYPATGYERLSKRNEQKRCGNHISCGQQEYRPVVALYKNFGMDGLKEKKRGRKKIDKISREQSLFIRRILTEKSPEQVGLPFYLWNDESLVHLIKKELKILISVWTARRYLKKWGFYFRHPVFEGYFAENFRALRWKRQSYPSLEKFAKKMHAEIFWCGTSPLGMYVEGKATGSDSGNITGFNGMPKNSRINVISAITNKGKLKFMVFKTAYSTNVFLRFLRRLSMEVLKNKLIILDGHPAHKTKKTKNWISGNKSIFLAKFQY